jgi:glycosyltransferase involved in cell wall biosynthesis
VLPFLEIGGADTFNLDLARQLAGRHGFAVSILTTLPAANAWRPQFAAITPDIAALHPETPPEDVPRRVLDLAHSRNVGAILVTHSALGYTLLPYLRAELPGVALLDYLHIEEPHWENGGYPRMSLDHAAQLDLTVVSSEHLRGWMLARGADAARLAVCHTNIDATQWNPSTLDRDALRAELAIVPDEPVVLFAGRLVPQKRPRLMAEVLNRLARRGLRFTALVVGEGPERGALERFAHTNRLGEQMRLLGAASNERVRELMAASDIFFLPSEREGIALTLFEAMAMSLAVVAADVGGQRELLVPECGTLVPPGADEAAAYEATLARLLSNPKQRSAMGLAARRRVVAHFPLDAMGDRMAALIDAARVKARETPQVATADAAHRAVIAAVALARQNRQVAQLWQSAGTAPEQRLPPARHALLGAVRVAKHVFRPLYRRAAARDDHWLRRMALGARAVLVRWIYRN